MLSDLPFEILQKIVDPLDVASARSLARTCSALTAVSESIIWRSVDITSGWDSKIDRPDLMQQKFNEYLTRQSVVESKLRHTVYAIIMDRRRLQWITTLRIEPSDGDSGGILAKSMVSLLQMLAPKLRRLDFLPLPLGENPGVLTCMFGYDILNATLEKAKTPFPKLVHLKIAFEATGYHNYGWILRMQNLREVETWSNDCYSSTLLFGGPAGHCLPHLSRLTVNNVRKDMYERSLKILSTFVLISPNISFLRVSGEWMVDGAERVMAALEKSQHFKTFVAKASRERRDNWREGSPEVRFAVPAEGLGMEEMVVDSYGWTELNETSFRSMNIPEGQALERVTVLTTPRMPLSQYASLSLDAPPHETGEIDGLFQTEISRCPKLSTFLLLYLEKVVPSPYDPHFVEPEYFVSPLRWEKEGHRGMILREYTSRNDKLNEHPFWHIRILSRTIKDPDTGVTWVGARRCWQDYTLYDGIRVPRNVMQAVYRISGQDPTFREGGRRLEMAEEAFEMLKEWREWKRSGEEAATN